MADPYHVSLPSQYSSDVSIYSEVEDRRIELAGVLGNRCTLRHVTQLRPCDADLVIVIDGDEYRSRVSFPNGISAKPLEVVECVGPEAVGSD
jgi:hypothetical protein